MSAPNMIEVVRFTGGDEGLHRRICHDVQWHSFVKSGDGEP